MNTNETKTVFGRKEIIILMAICLSYSIWTVSYKLGKQLALRDNIANTK
ncbi:hypothetical protein SAMN05216464_102280 [Mucilaginibacter pineti]|uniref:Uncharacterized protein n=1 Tax=Mucilaginibacter pineti TaxID=1391627 RepID=A0A1G6WSE3_9SPHI|nr:hypothetical protein [Mucilaginibacter pineti]SDD68734.1 hypothetical protein SAMN05216464_102280 [Mucilaginibacter pineti]